MAQSSFIPRGLRFTYEASVKTYDDQMKWIDALDTKAGILIAADGVIATLVLTRGSMLIRGPRLVAGAVAAALFISLVLALLSFATRRFELAPNIDQLVAEMHRQDDDTLRTLALDGVISAIDVNALKVDHKAALLFYACGALLIGVLLLGSYVIYALS